MAHVEDVQEDVSPPLIGGIFKDETSVSVERVESLVRHIAQVGEEFLDWAALLAGSEKVQIGIRALEGSMRSAGTVIQHGNPTKQA